MTKEKGGRRTFKCRNPLCGKTFAKPLKIVSLHHDPAEPYVCPYCLTKINEAQEVNKEAEKAPDETKKKPTQDKPKPLTCHYHLGYLSEEKKQQIPEECLVCSDIIQCTQRKLGT